MTQASEWVLYINDDSWSETEQVQISSRPLSHPNLEFTNLLVSDTNLRRYSLELIQRFTADQHSHHDLRLAGLHFQAKCFFILNSATQQQLGVLLVLLSGCPEFNELDARSLLAGGIKPLTETFRDHSKIKTKTKKVLQLTAMGFSTQEISKVLYMTNRGVEYHLEIAKSRLGAVNRPSTVFLAREYGWI